MNYRYHPGQRTIKNALAVFCCLVFGYAFGLQDLLFSVIAAVLCMQPTRRRARFTGLNQLMGTFLGGGLGYLVYLPLCAAGMLRSPVQIVIIPVCILFLLYLCNLLEIREVCTICCIVFITVFEDPLLAPGAVLHALINRVAGLSIGIFFAVILTNLPLPFCKKRKKPYPEQSEYGKSDKSCQECLTGEEENDIIL